MTAVRRRLVLYLSGFDPRGARWYHALYRDEAAKQAAVSGHEISVGPRRRLGEHVVGWRIAARIEGETIETDYRFLEWDDVVRRFWVREPLRLAWVTLTASWRALRQGVFAKTFRWSWPAGVTATMPALLIVALVLLTAGLAAAGWLLLDAAGLLVALLAGAALFWFAHRVEQKFNLTWAGRILSFHEREAQSRTQLLDRRRDEFGAMLREALVAGEHDEILVVGHSYGAALAIAVAARGLSAARSGGPRLSLLTLGQTVMWLAWLPEAEAMRAEIAAVATSDAIDWVDVSAPPDGACFALVDPFTAIGDRDPGRANPKLLNAKFHEIMPPALFEKAGRNWMRVHFQYLHAGVRPAEYDYFAITAGPKTLAGRFAARPSARDFTRLRRGRMKAVR